MLLFLFFCLLTVVMGALINHFCSQYIFACPECKKREVAKILADNATGTTTLEDCMDSLFD